ncbi:MAG: T9SS type A sorting domain-containing protein, partial [bacterium]
DTLSIMHFVYPEHYNNAIVDFDNVNEMIQILESYYGQYPYYNEKYGVAEYVGYWGGMEYQTLSSVQPYFITGNHTYDDLFVHELAHQWWGDCITPKDFHHSWISEGVATFTEALYFGHLEGEARYHSYMNNENNALDLKGVMYRHDVGNPDRVYASIVYYKGAWVLHMLRHIVGEENFWAGLQEYRSQFEYSSATTEDLQHAFEKVVGDSLGWFFRQWVYEPNYPHYAYGWLQEDIGAGQYKLVAFIDQIQTDAPLFKMPLDLTVTTASRETTLVMIVSDSMETFQYIASEPIINFQLDKDNWVLKKATFTNSPILDYMSHQVVDSTENNNGLAEPGEKVELWLTIRNKGILAQNITAEIISNDPDIQILSSKVDFGDLDHAQFAHNIAPPFSFSVTANAIGHISTFQLHIAADNDYSTIDSFDVKIGNPNILLVDDDDGANYEQYFNQPMSLAKIYSDSWEAKSRGVPLFTDVLQNYQTIIWFTGNDRSTSLTSEEQQAIAEYLDHGGWLVLTGQDIGYDLMADGSPEDSSFFTDYLHAEYLADTVKSTMIRGEVGDPIGNGLLIYLQDRPGSAGNQKAPSSIAPRDGANTFLKYIPQNSVAGIRYMNTNRGYRLVYLSFGFEGISGPYQDSAQKLLTRILTWLSGATEVTPLESEIMPKHYLLEQNFPNPFNPTTKIRYHLPKPDHAEISIFNLKGQKIKTLIDKQQFAGVYELIWDGTDNHGSLVTSGVYIYKLVTKSFTSSKKLALIK